MFGESERKFIVDPDGKAEVVEPAEKKPKQSKKIIGMEKDRKFVVDEKGEATMEGDNKEKIVIKDI